MPSDTFKFVPAGLAPAPGTCMICGSNQRDFIDWGREAEYYGAILFCVDCVKDITNVEQLGITTTEEIDKLNKHLVEMTHELKTLREYREKVRNGVLFVLDDIGDSYPVGKSVRGLDVPFNQKPGPDDF